MHKQAAKPINLDGHWKKLTIHRAAGFRIRIRKDPHIFESEDPDPQKNADPDPWTKKNAEKMEKST